MRTTLMENNKISSLVFNNFTNDSRVLKEVKSLASSGFKVEVIAHNDVNTLKEEKTNAFTIKRVSFLDRKTANVFVKIRAYIKYIKESIKLSKNSFALHCNDLNTLPIAYIVKKFHNKNIKIVYDAHEYETETNGLKGLKKTLIKLAEKFFIKHTDKIITVSKTIAEEYSNLYSLTEQPHLVLNCPPYTDVTKKDIFRKKYNIASDALIFLYQGGLSKGRGIEMILESFITTKNKKNVIIFMGYGELYDMIKKKTSIHDNIYLHDAVAPTVLLDYTASADFGISMIEDTCLSYKYCLPNKLFEYIMAEIPVIVSNLPEMKKIVIENDIGIVIENSTVLGLTNSIEKANRLDKEKAIKNLALLKEKYNWEKQEKELIAIYKSL